MPYGDSFVIVGGFYSGSATFLKTVYIYDTASNSFKLSRGSELSVGMRYPAAVPLKDAELYEC